MFQQITFFFLETTQTLILVKKRDRVEITSHKWSEIIKREDSTKYCAHTHVMILYLNFIARAHEITLDAKNELFREFETRTNINIVEIDDILSAVIEYQLSEEILNYQRRKS